MEDESVSSVLNRLLQKSPRREAALPASSESPKTGSAIDTLPKHQSEGDNGKPMFTAAELQSVKAYLKLYSDGCALLGDLQRAALRPGVSDSELKQILKLIDETIATIQPIKKLVDALNRFSAKREKVLSLIYECTVLLDNWEISRKLDRILLALEPKPHEPPAQKPISTMAEFCERIVQKN